MSRCPGSDALCLSPMRRRRLVLSFSPLPLAASGMVLWRESLPGLPSSPGVQSKPVMITASEVNYASRLKREKERKLGWLWPAPVILCPPPPPSAQVGS
ncbi:hypothetical protein U9M48_033323 [Paspalum notatum var. saurae]|uniref:Uncharacterized protein n=1 Tax=Paspalum notatum var. saurae TaxID=547442 RepID=A0AAQ3U6P0_PASNO